MRSYYKKWLKIAISISLFTFLAISIIPSPAWSVCATTWSRDKDWGSSETLTEPDLEGEYDRGYTFGTDCFNTSSGHGHDGSDSKAITAGITGQDWDTIWTDAVHSHASDAEGSQLDWDDIWTDAVHSHASNAEGGTVTAHASTIAESITVALIGTESASDGQILTVDGDGGASFQAAANPGKVLQIVSTSTGAVATGTTAMNSDDSFPEKTEGDEYMTLAITPAATDNRLLIFVTANVAHSAVNESIMALFQDSTTNALAAVQSQVVSAAANIMKEHHLTHEMAAGTTSATTFKVRIGGVSTGATTTFNGQSGGRLFEGVALSSITILEIDQ